MSAARADAQLGVVGVVLLDRVGGAAGTDPHVPGRDAEERVEVLTEDVDQPHR